MKKKEIWYEVGIPIWTRAIYTVKATSPKEALERVGSHHPSCRQTAEDRGGKWSRRISIRKVLVSKVAR